MKTRPGGPLVDYRREHIEQAKPVREHVSTVLDSEMLTWWPDVIFSNHQICTCTGSRLGYTYVA